MTDICFLDTETLGLDIDAPIWEFAAIRRNSDGEEKTVEFFIRHDDPYQWLDLMPSEFAEDYAKRFNPLTALKRFEAANRIYLMTVEAHIVGAVPNFDTERLAKLMKGVVTPRWHYHLIDVENLAVGYLAAKDQLMQPPWKSDDLSRAIGVDPEQFSRHTAMGDVKWIRAQWDAIMGKQ
jgi:hypothetical protein